MEEGQCFSLQKESWGEKDELRKVWAYPSVTATLKKNTMIIRNQHENRNLVQKRRVDIVWFGHSTYQVVLGIAEHKLRMNKWRDMNL